MKAVRLFLLLPLLSAFCVAQHATLIIVRHADKLSDAPDALLSPRGLERAQCLAQTLEGAKLAAIFATDVVRTQQTAAPVAKQSGIAETVLPKRDMGALVAKLRSASGTVLIVSHGDVIPQLVTQLGAGPEAEIPGNEYSRMIVIHLENGRATPALNLHYCPRLR